MARGYRLGNVNGHGEVLQYYQEEIYQLRESLANHNQWYNNESTSTMWAIVEQMQLS